MHDLMAQTYTYIEKLSEVIPVELFVLIGSLIEEIVAPIPSPFVMTLAGSLAKLQGQGWIYILWLSALGAVGKTAGAWVLYIVADKLEDLFAGKVGKLLGFSHKELEDIGKRLNGGWKDNVVLFVLRALPIMPSAPVSLACGVIKINMRTYISSTFFGTMVRNLLYLYLGYAGVSNYKNIIDGFEGVESIIQIVIFLTIGIVIGLVYLQRHRSKKKTK